MKKLGNEISSGSIEPIFIVGMNGSGTTMLLDSLGRHSQLYGFPLETRELPYIITSSIKTQNLGSDKDFHEAWVNVQNVTAFKLENKGELVPIPENWSDYPRELSAIINYFFTYFSEKKGKIRWCEKSPQHVQHMELLSQIFPKARFIHIIRDGRDCAASFHRRWKRRPELALYRWKNIVSKGRQAGLAMPDSYFELKYEDITSSPDYWMKEICKFLEIPFDENILVSRQPQSKNRGTIGSIKPNSEKWKTYYSKQQLEKLERIAGEELSKLGYEVSYQQLSNDPSRTSLMYWRLSDYFIMFTGEIRRKINGESTRPWFGLLRLPGIAYKQWRSNKY